MLDDIDFKEYFTDQQIKEFRALFETHDVNSTGSIKGVDVPSFFTSLGLRFTDSQVVALVKEMSPDGTGRINFEDLATMLVQMMGVKIRADRINYREYLSESKIDKFEMLFKQADTNGVGYIGKEDLKLLFTRFSVNMTDQQISDIVHEVDKSGSGQVGFEEFCCMMAKLTNSKKRILYREFLTDEQGMFPNHFISSSRL